MSDVDIVVQSRRTGRTVLAVEAKLSGQMTSAYEQLRRFMGLVGCPAGVAIVGQRLGILHEGYGPGPAGQIDVVGEFDTRAIPELAPPERGPDAAFEFERRIYAWLESLVDPGAADRLPRELGSRLREHVIPWLEVGELQATGPRPSRAPAA